MSDGQSLPKFPDEPGDILYLKDGGGYFVRGHQDWGDPEHRVWRNGFGNIVSDDSVLDLWICGVVTKRKVPIVDGWRRS